MILQVTHHGHYTLQSLNLKIETHDNFLFTAKELKAQMAERQAKQYDEALRDAEITNRMKLETERAVELDKKKEEERYADQIRYQQVSWWT